MCFFCFSYWTWISVSSGWSRTSPGCLFLWCSRYEFSAAHMRKCCVFILFFYVVSQNIHTLSFFYLQFLQLGMEIRSWMISTEHESQGYIWFSTGFVWEIKLRLSTGRVNAVDVFQDYTLEGEFGTATDDFSHMGRVVERSTYGRTPYVYVICE